MSSKNMSPVVHANARTLKMVHPGYSQRGRNEHMDLMLILILCFVAYGLFMFFFMPSMAPGQYARVTAELNYHWQNEFSAWEYRYYTTYLPSLKSLLQEGLSFIGR